MANARIDIVGREEYGLICDLYNQIFSPPKDPTFLAGRMDHHRKSLMMVAELERRPVGFLCGYELRPSTYYTWLIGVLPDARRLGVASQLADAEEAWVMQQGYEMMRFECYNQHRPVIFLAIKRGYDIVGIRWDFTTGGNHIIFEKQLLDV